MACARGGEHTCHVCPEVELNHSPKMSDNVWRHPVNFGDLMTAAKDGLVHDEDGDCVLEVLRWDVTRVRGEVRYVVCPGGVGDVYWRRLDFFYIYTETDGEPSEDDIADALRIIQTSQEAIT